MAGAPVELIKRVPLFSDLDGKELRQVAGSFKERTFSAGETVVGEESGPSRFFVIGDGTASVTVHGEERATLGAGDYFGEIALIDGGLRTATVAAETDMKAYSTSDSPCGPGLRMDSFGFERLIATPVPASTTVGMMRM